MLAHVLLATVHSEPILNALERGAANRLDRTLRDLVNGLMPEASPGEAVRGVGAEAAPDDHGGQQQ